MRHAQKELQVLEKSLRDHFIGHYPILGQQSLKHFPDRGHNLLNNLALHFVVRLRESPRGHRVDLTVQLWKPSILQKCVL